MLSRVSLFHIVQFLLFMNINQDIPADGIEYSGLFDLSRLEHDIPVGEEDGSPPLFDALNHFEGIGVQPLGEWIMNQKMRDRQQMRVARVLSAVPLKSPQVIRIAQLPSQLFEDRPVSFLPLVADFALKITPQVFCYPIVVQQRIIHVEEKDNVRRYSHAGSIAYREAPADMLRLFHFIDHCHRIVLDRNATRSVCVPDQLVRAEAEHTSALTREEIG